MAIATGNALAWLPILIRFTRAWRTRNNPVSLAICALIAFALYMPLYIAVTFPPRWPTATVLTLGWLSCGMFYVAFRYADRKFPSDRS